MRSRGERFFCGSLHLRVRLGTTGELSGSHAHTHTHLMNEFMYKIRFPNLSFQYFLKKGHNLLAFKIKACRQQSEMIKV